MATVTRPEHSLFSNFPVPKSRLGVIATTALGAALIIAAVVMNQPWVARINEGVVGGVVVLVSLLAMRFDLFRLVNLAAGMWLLLTARPLFHLSGAPEWAVYLLGIAVFMLALVPNPAPQTSMREPTNREP
ncbi:MAG: hypothetical protein IPJ65_39990 [Archangiaceae bacterium]|nr:hypothetical protein [Archangiaceae bacterium]